MEYNDIYSLYIKYADRCKKMIKDNFFTMEDTDGISMKHYEGDSVKSIYIGGGTPSCLNIEQLKKLFNIISIFDLNKNVELLDTPGILWPKFEDKEVGIRLALIGSIREELLNISELAVILIQFLVDNYQGVLFKNYDADETKDSIEILRAIAIKRACKTKGDTYDLDRAASFLIDDFRSGKLGNISLETPIN